MTNCGRKCCLCDCDRGGDCQADFEVVVCGECTAAAGAVARLEHRHPEIPLARSQARLAYLETVSAPRQVIALERQLMTMWHRRCIEKN
jgi:hypothetical protein